VVDIEQTLEALGIEGRVSGNEFVGHCPMHLARTGREDGHPSWSINLGTGLFLCFSCGYRGSVITLISDLKGVSFDVAKTLTVKPDMQATVLKIPAAYVAVHANPTLSDARLQKFTVPPAWARRRRHLTTESCALYGVRWDPTNELWITPIRKPTTNELLGWQEKGETHRVFRNFPTNVKKSQTLFGYDVFEGGRMIVVESPLDAVRLHASGVQGAVAAMGAVVSKAQILLMSAADEVVFCMDNPATDKAGRVSSLSLLHDTKGVLKSVRFFNYNGIDAKDPGDMTEAQIDQGISDAKSRAYGERAIL